MPKTSIKLGSECDPSFVYTWLRVYFHGAAESLIAEIIEEYGWHCSPDIVAGNVDPDSVGDNRIYVDVYGKRGYVFIWTTGYSDTLFPDGTVRPTLLRAGLVVLENDDKSYEYAERKYEQHSSIL